VSAVNLPAPPFLRAMVDAKGFVTAQWRPFVQGLYNLVYGEGVDKVDAAYVTAHAAAPGSTAVVGVGGLHGGGMLKDGGIGLSIYKTFAPLGALPASGNVEGDLAYAQDVYLVGAGSATGAPVWWSNGAWTLVNGSTASTSPVGYVTTTGTPAAGNLTKFSGASSITNGAASLTADVSGTLPVSNGGTGTATAFTTGSVVFAGASGVYAQDNAHLFWDATNHRLGVGTAAPGVALDVAGPIQIAPGASVTPSANGDVVFEFTSNTTLTIRAKGSDGTVRSVALTLA
jgi:hypothetical protein